jgi:hypothetical protein
MVQLDRLFLFAPLGAANWSKSCRAPLPPRAAEIVDLVWALLILAAVWFTVGILSW